MSSESLRDTRKVLVTGAGGFIGRHLVADQLARGREVVALDLRLDPVRHLESRQLVLLEGDIGDVRLLARATEGADTVFHLAAAHLSVATPATEFSRVNVEAAGSLIAAAESAGVSRFVHCSTVGVYGSLAAVPADETSPCNPEFAYERTKLEAEQMLLSAFRDRGFPVVVLRPAWVYGPGCPRTDKLFRAIARGRFVMAGSGEVLRHSVYIRDAVLSFEAAATSSEALGEAVIVADERAVSVRALIDEIASVLGVRRPSSVPRSALYLAGLGAELLFKPLRREPPLSRRTLRFFSGNTSFRTEKAKRVLGFEATYSLEEGIAETHRIWARGDFWSVPMPPAPLVA